MAYATVSITATAPAQVIVAANPLRHSVIIANTASGTLYLGPDPSVTASNGMPLLTNGKHTEDAGGTALYKGPLYGLMSTGTGDIRYWERTQQT